MQQKLDFCEITRAIGFARQGLDCAFDDFVRGKSKSVSGFGDACEARESLEILRYLRGLAFALMSVADIVPDLENACLRWVDQDVTRIEGEKPRKTLARVLKKVDRVEDAVTSYLSTPLTLAPARYTPVRTDDTK